MIFPPIVLIIGILLIVASIIDAKTKSVPSALLTSMIVIPLTINAGLGYYGNIAWGIVAFAFALLLYDLDYFSGVADIKVMTALGFFISSIYQMGIFILLIGVFGLMWKTSWVIYFKKFKKTKIPDEFPFLPVFLLVYGIMILVFSFLL